MQMKRSVIRLTMILLVRAHGRSPTPSVYHTTTGAIPQALAPLDVVAVQKHGRSTKKTLGQLRRSRQYPGMIVDRTYCLSCLVYLAHFLTNSFHSSPQAVHALFI